MMGGRAAGAGVDPDHWIITQVQPGHWPLLGTCTLGMVSCPGEEITPPTLSRLEEDCINRL